MSQQGLLKAYFFHFFVWRDFHGWKFLEVEIIFKLWYFRGTSFPIQKNRIIFSGTYLYISSERSLRKQHKNHFKTSFLLVFIPKINWFRIFIYPFAYCLGLCFSLSVSIAFLFSLFIDLYVYYGNLFLKLVLFDRCHGN